MSYLRQGMLYKYMQNKNENFEPIVLSKKDYAYVKNIEKNWTINCVKNENLDSESDVNKAVSLIIKREVINILFSLFERTVQVPIGNELVNVNIYNINFNLNLSFENISNKSTIWFLRTIKKYLESNNKPQLIEFLSIANFGITSEPTMYKILYNKFETITPDNFIFNEHIFSVTNKINANTYTLIRKYWESVNKPDTIYLSTLIVYLISNYYTCFDSIVNSEDRKEKIQYDINKFAFAIKQLLSESSSSIEERKEKVNCIRNVFDIATEIKIEYDKIYKLLSSKNKVDITQSQRIFYDYCSNHISVINETSALAALIKV